MLNIGVKKAVYTCCPNFLHPVMDRVKSSEIGYRLTKAAFWSVAGEGISRGLGLLAVIFVARILGQSVFGEFGMIRSTMGMFGLFAGFGMALTATKHVAEFRSKDPEKAGRIIGLSNAFALGSAAVIGGVVFLAAPWLSEHVLKAPHLENVLQVAIILLVFSTLSGAQKGALAGFESFKAIAAVNAIAGFAAFPILIGGAYFGGLRGAVYGLALNMGIIWFLNCLALRRVASRFSVPIKFKGFAQDMKILWTFSLPAFVSGTMVGPVLWYARTTLAGQPDGYAELGVFEAGFAWLMIIVYLSSNVSRSSLPILSQTYGDGLRRQFAKTLKMQFLFNGTVTLLFALLVALFSKVIMGSYGHGFAEESSVLVILAFTGVFMQLAQIAGLVNKSIGNIWWGVLLNFLWACMVVIGSYFLSSKGAIGLSLAFLLAYAGHFLFTMIYVGFVFRLSPKLRMS